MRPIQNAGGHVGLSAREYPIAYNTAVKAGAVVSLSGGAAALATTAALLGVTAENHPGTADALNPRANGTGILVYDNPELIFECNAPTFACAGGSTTTVTAASSVVAASTADIFNGGLLVGPDGVEHTVADYAQAESVSTFTVATTTAPTAADVYTLYPPIGGTGVGLSSDGTAVTLASAGAKLKVVGWDKERGKIRLMAVEHALGVEN